jgi:hypothetical protein
MLSDQLGKSILVKQCKETHFSAIFAHFRRKCSSFFNKTHFKIQYLQYFEQIPTFFAFFGRKKIFVKT